MKALTDVLAGVGAFVSGLVARLGVVLALMVLLLVPVLIAAGGIRLVRRVGSRGKDRRPPPGPAPGPPPDRRG